MAVYFLDSGLFPEGKNTLARNKTKIFSRMKNVDTALFLSFPRLIFIPKKHFADSEGFIYRHVPMR